MAKLNTEQKETIARWADAGASLNEIQDRMKRELGITLTYLETRLLIAELGIFIKQPKKEIPAQIVEAAPDADLLPEKKASASVTLTVDQIAETGAMVSGTVTFSDGKTAIWYLDQSGQLGMKAPDPGYQPPAADIPVFQEELGKVLQQAGY